jgi:hypothetical protein
MKRPVLLDSEWVRPSITDDKPQPCASCLKIAARWGVGKPPNNYFSCAYCFLYRTPWGKDNALKIRDLVIEVEGEMGRSISDDGIVQEGEADRILSSIVAISGIAKARAQRRMRDEGSRP